MPAMNDDLHDDLTDIRGVGDATADTILDVLADHDGGDSGPQHRYLQRAIEAATTRNDAEAAMFLRRYADEQAED